jgi:SAM-dependent methyltransferase
MNNKIFKLITENLKNSFNLPKYSEVKYDANTILLDLPWTPARFRKFQEIIEYKLDLDSTFKGTIQEIVDDFDKRYMYRFFSEIWKPKTDVYAYTGWGIVEEVNKLNPKAVLDVGCGYNQFKSRIPNLVGIDPCNHDADYMVDILDYKVADESYDAIIAFGSINFNSKKDIEERFAHCVRLLSKNGKMFFRVNPGISHKNGPWVDIFPWSFEVVNEFVVKYNLTLEIFKKDNNDRLYFVVKK